MKKQNPVVHETEPADEIIEVSDDSQQPRKPHKHSRTVGPAWSREKAREQKANHSAAMKLQRDPRPVGRPPGPMKLDARRSRLAMDCARCALGGATNKEIATKLGVSEPTIARLRQHPDYPRAIERARAALRADSDDAANVGRAEALDAARGVVKLFNAGDERVGPADAMKAAQLLTTASAPTPATYDARAKKALLDQLTAPTRKLVIAELQGASSAYLENLSDEELDQLLGD